MGIEGDRERKQRRIHVPVREAGREREREKLG